MSSSVVNMHIIILNLHSESLEQMAKGLISYCRHRLSIFTLNFLF